MKSRISFFNGAVFRKNLTRFAPVWGLYTVCMFLGLMMMLGSYGWLSRNLITCIQIMSVITPCFALVCAQTLFGDLYNTRMCNALHAMPLRRETWLGTNLVSGLVFHLIPTGTMALAAFLILNPFAGHAECLTALFWFLGVNLQFLFHFGLAVFCAFCVGSRFAQAVVYGMLEFLSVILGWLVDILYIPQLYGVEMNTDPFFWFCPIVNMIENPFLSAWLQKGDEPNTMVASYILRDQLGEGQTIYVAMESGFVWYFVYALVGIVLAALAFRLYRKRRLECAGDFMAVKGMEPVFLGVYILMMGAVFCFFTGEIFNIENYLYLYAGLSVGWFTGRMLLERSVRVFRLRTFGQWACILVAFTVSLLAVIWDPFGIESWVPEAREVRSITIFDSYSGRYGRNITVEDPEGIEGLLSLHQDALDDWQERKGSTISHTAVVYEDTKENYEEGTFTFGCTLSYQMKNGTHPQRHYNIPLNEESYQFLCRLFSRPEVVLGNNAQDEEAFLDSVGAIIVRAGYDGYETYVTDPQDIRALYQAVMADCALGNMSQDWTFHRDDNRIYWLRFGTGNEIMVFADAENTLQWLREFGLNVDAMIKKCQEG